MRASSIIERLFFVDEINWSLVGGADDRRSRLEHFRDTEWEGWREEEKKKRTCYIFVTWFECCNGLLFSMRVFICTINDVVGAVAVGESSWWVSSEDILVVLWFAVERIRESFSPQQHTKLNCNIYMYSSCYAKYSKRLISIHRL